MPSRLRQGLVDSLVDMLLTSIKEWPSLETGPYHLDPNTFIGRASQIGRLLDVIREQESQSNSDEDTLAAMYLSDHQQQLGELYR